MSETTIVAHGFNASAFKLALAEIADKVVQGAEHSSLVDLLPINPIEKELVSFALTAGEKFADAKLQAYIKANGDAQAQALATLGKAVTDAQEAAAQAQQHAMNARSAALSIPTSTTATPAGASSSPAAGSTVSNDAPAGATS